MIPIMLVDDEPLIKFTFRKVVDLEQHGYKIVAEAFHGQDALSYLNNGNPLGVQIIVTDIKMPEMDGIELMQVLRETYPEIGIIVLSSYDDFNLLRQTYQYGVEHYILKTELSEEVVLGALEKVAKDMLRKETEDVYLKKNAYELLTRETFFNSLLLPDANLSQLSLEAAQLGLRLRFRRSSYVVMHIKVEYTPQDDFSPRIFHNIESYIVINRILEEVGCGDCFPISEGEFAVLFSYLQKESTVNKMKQLAREIVSALLEERSNHVFQNLSFGISSVSRESGFLRDLYHEAVSACSYSFVVGKNQLITPSVLPQFLGVEPMGNVEALRRILTGGTSDAEEELYSLKIAADQVHAEHIPSIKKIFQTYFHELYQYIMNNKVSQKVEDLFKQYDKLVQADADLASFNRWIKAIATAVHEELNNSSEMLRKAKNYIEGNLKEVSLSSVSAEIGVSPGYLSKLFKKEEGMGFSEYLTEQRIEQSILLMRNSNMKLYEIAAHVGYKNPEHFSRTFKKKVGEAPKIFLSSGTNE